MTLYLHELRRGRLALIIWTAALAFMLMVCVIIYPEMKSQMAELGDMFADMGAFSDAFSMEMLTGGDFLGYFSMECGEVLGIGGAIFAAILGAGMLAKEQRDHTAEWLLTLPLSRTNIVLQKLLAMLTQIVLLNVVVVALTLASVAMIGEQVDAAKTAWIFISYLILQLQIGLMCFGISAFLKRGGTGIALGLSLGLYSFNLLANLTEGAEFLKYFTPFAYTNGTYILDHTALEWKYVAIGTGLAIIGTMLAFVKYKSKDIK